MSLKCYVRNKFSISDECAKKAEEVGNCKSLRFGTTSEINKPIVEHRYRILEFVFLQCCLLFGPQIEKLAFYFLDFKAKK